jgi:hypothetical protein
MAFRIGKAYSRANISEELGIARDLRSVIVAEDGEVLAIVANTNGFNRLNGKQYRNVLTAETFVMQGDNDDQGPHLEKPVAVPLFFAHGDAGYRYEGKVTWTKTEDAQGNTWREFVRVPAKATAPR